MKYLRGGVFAKSMRQRRPPCMRGQGFLRLPAQLEPAGISRSPGRKGQSFWNKRKGR
jgi:hypothetical protein